MPHASACPVSVSHPPDTNVQRYLQLTESQLSTYHQKEKQLYLGMFG